jgi:hypothetical protein
MGPSRRRKNQKRDPLNSQWNEVEAPVRTAASQFADCLKTIVMEKYQERKRAINPTTFNRMTVQVL